MKKVFLILIIPYLLSAQYKAQISKIPKKIARQMIDKGSWRNGCPVEMYDLRYLKINYLDFNYKKKTGEMIVHKSVAYDVVEIFRELYNSNYPIKQMKIISHYNANDFASIEADNTSAFNCRKVTSGKKWSNHSYGKAIDINPIENPYISKSGYISHPKSFPFRKRVHKHNTSKDKAMIIKNDYIIQLFKERGWKWGGNWRTIKDYQHFEKSVKNRALAKPREKYIPVRYKGIEESDVSNLY